MGEVRSWAAAEVEADEQERPHLKEQVAHLEPQHQGRPQIGVVEVEGGGHEAKAQEDADKKAPAIAGLSAEVICLGAVCHHGPSQTAYECCREKRPSRGDGQVAEVDEEVGEELEGREYIDERGQKDERVGPEMLQDEAELP